MIVEAVGVSVNVGVPRDKALGARIEAAMVQAIKDCQADGITYPDEIRARMMAAREAVLEDVGRGRAE
jgi:hypothetical protein